MSLFTIFLWWYAPVLEFLKGLFEKKKKEKNVKDLGQISYPTSYQSCISYPSDLEKRKEL